MKSFEYRYDVRYFRRTVRLSVAKASSDDPLFLSPHDIDLSTLRRATKTPPEGGFGPTSPSARLLSAPPSGQLRPSGSDGADLSNSSIGPSSVAGGPLCSGSNACELVETSTRVAPSISSAMHWPDAFCEMREVRPPPSFEQLIMGWSSVFSDTSTFAKYASRLQKV